jgi:hypothetical protein
MYLDWEGITVNLHMFTPTDGELVWHPHPWPAAFMITDGSYELQLGLSEDGSSPDSIGPVIMSAGSYYQMISPDEWHSVRPLERTFTIAVQGPVYDVDWSFEADDRGHFRELTDEEKEPIISHYSDKDLHRFIRESINKYEPNKNGMYSLY